MTFTEGQAVHAAAGVPRNQLRQSRTSHWLSSTTPSGEGNLELRPVTA